MRWTVERYVLREVVQTWVAVTGVLVAILLGLVAVVQRLGGRMGIG